MPYHLLEKKSDLIIPKNVRNMYHNMIYFLNQKKFALNELEASFILTNLKHHQLFNYKNNLSLEKVNWNNKLYSISYRVKSNLEQIKNPFQIIYSKNRKHKIKYQINMDYFPMISKILYNTGEYFEGQIKNEEPNGYGTIILNELMIYEGPFLNGLFHGYGLIKFSNNIYYATHFENGLNLNGGTLYSEDFIYEENMYNQSNKLFGLYEVLLNYKNSYKNKFASKKIISSYKSIFNKKRVISNENDDTPSSKKARYNQVEKILPKAIPKTIQTRFPTTLENPVSNSICKKMRYNPSEDNKNNPLFPIHDYKSWINTSQNMMSKNLKNI